MKQLNDAFTQGRIVLDLDASDFASAVRKSIHHLVAEGILSRSVAGA
jgi:hypothetical protein